MQSVRITGTKLALFVMALTAVALPTHSQQAGRVVACGSTGSSGVSVSENAEGANAADACNRAVLAVQIALLGYTPRCGLCPFPQPRCHKSGGPFYDSAIEPGTPEFFDPPGVWVCNAEYSGHITITCSPCGGD